MILPITQSYCREMAWWEEQLSDTFSTCIWLGLRPETLEITAIKQGYIGVTLVSFGKLEWSSPEQTWNYDKVVITIAVPYSKITINNENCSINEDVFNIAYTIKCLLHFIQAKRENQGPLLHCINSLSWDIIIPYDRLCNEHQHSETSR